MQSVQDQRVGGVISVTEMIKLKDVFKRRFFCCEIVTKTFQFEKSAEGENNFDPAGIGRFGPGPTNGHPFMKSFWPGDDDEHKVRAPPSGIHCGTWVDGRFLDPDFFFKFTTCFCRGKENYFRPIKKR
ncbi:hypothetical protein BV898_06877 [Hypsibius exemplaris]|uniref:Uncharacterized protein n=1 Tax=Hypsibius exemplaris TaxID=2072580 RepID=A0A1W0WV16_HYPEX|nr:hypothetical protein BV898_06877 [Hypsibius exemplaris]